MTEKTIVQKMFVKPGSKMMFYHSPPGYQQIIGDLPEGCLILPDTSGDSSLDSNNEKADFIHAFIANKAELLHLLPILKARLANGGALWISYYKGTSRFPTDINRDSIWDIGRQHGMDAVRQIAIDQDWSAIRFKVID